jgi:AcrR family transcriptional regulator
MEPSSRAHNRTAAERRDMVVEAAIAEFAQKGLHGTATEDIARRAGISQPYIFRLFGTKKDLFIAAADRVYDRITALFQEAAASAESAPLEAMGHAYIQLLARREELLMLLQMFAAAADPDVRAAVGARYLQLFERAQEVARVDAEEARAFFAHGMLLTVVAALDLPGVLGFADWSAFAQECARRGIPLPAPSAQP